MVKNRGMVFFGGVEKNKHGKINVANWNLGKVKLKTIFADQWLVPEDGVVLGFI